MFIRTLVILAASLFAAPASPVPAEAALPQFSPDALRCQRATINRSVDFLRASLTTRQACLQARVDQQIPAETDCLVSTAQDSGHAETDLQLRRAEAELAQEIARACTGFDFSELQFPGPCPDPDGAPYDSLNHANCLMQKINATVAKLLPIQYAPLPEGLADLRQKDRNCQDDIATKSGRLLIREFRDRALCIFRQLDGRASVDAECRREAERNQPDTGDTQTDNDVLSAHNKVLVGIAETCNNVDLSDIGAPNACEHPEGSVFGLAQLVECMFETHHLEAFRLIDVVTPWGSMCGNGELNVPPEDCDDGDQTFTRGEACMPDCTATKCGDADGDSAVDVVDAMLVVRSAIGVFPCSAGVCDVDGDGNHDATDAMQVLRRSVGQNVSMNCPAQ